MWINRYVDSTDDLQTAALLSGRLSAVHLERDSAPVRWLTAYRQLLNRKSLFLDRANLDVMLGRRSRQRAGSSASCDSNTMTLNPSSSSTSHSQSSVGKGSAKGREIYRPHPFCETPYVFLRCHFCSASLPADASQKQPNVAWQKKQGSLLKTCSNCKKALPRCYVCLMHLGMVNPQVEANRYMMHKRAASSSISISGGGASTDEQPEHSSLPLAHWFLFCQRCKHGGHAECIESWFETRPVKQMALCGVNGCQCVCQALR